jgi:hypothetical protein
MIPFPLIVSLVVEAVVWVAAATVAATVFGALGELILSGCVEQAEAEIASMDSHRRAELLESFLEERERMSPEQRARWEQVLRSQGLLD